MPPPELQQPEPESPQAPQPPELTAEEQALLDEYGLNPPTPELNKMPPNIYKDVDLAGTIRKNAPLLSKVGDKVGEQIPRSIDAYVGLLSRAGSAVAEQHREQVAAMDEYKKASNDRAVKSLIKDFFSGKPSVEAARIVIESESTSERQKTAARAYLKMQGEM